MTKEEKDRIFNQLYELEERHPAFAENVRDNSYCEAIADVKRIIEGIKEQPSLPSNIDEAANEYTTEYTENENGNGGDDWEDDIAIAFKAGAGWMVNQHLELTWKDVVLFRTIFDAMDSKAEHGTLEVQPMTKDYYEEVLKRFLEKKRTKQ